MRKMILAGGSGYLGSVLVDYFKDKVQSIIILSRGPQWQQGNVQSVRWDGKTPGSWQAHLEEADLLVNLTGKNVNCRYTEANKKEILQSRLEATRVLRQAVAEAKQPPKLWIQCASATIYRHAEDRPMDEETGEIGVGFSVDVCKAWERAFWEQPAPQTRKVLLRIGIVLGREDGAFPRLLNLVRTGMGGHQGNGGQYVSWIHETDVAGIIRWVAGHPEVEGTLNCTSPEPISNVTLMKMLRQTYGMPFGFRTPAWLLEIASWLIGTETELVLKSRWVIPKRLLEAGYRFQFPRADYAIHDLVSTRNYWHRKKKEKGEVRVSGRITSPYAG